MTTQQIPQTKRNFESHTTYLTSQQLQRVKKNWNFDQERIEVERVVLIDDDSIFNFISEKLLLKFEARIACKSFTDPRRALAYMEDQEVDLILLDLNIPYLNGWQFLEAMEERGFESPVFILTSSILKEDADRAEKHPLVKGYVSKPLEIRHLESICLKGGRGLTACLLDFL